MGSKCTKCGMSDNTIYYTNIHHNRRHCRIHNLKNNLLCHDCENDISDGGCYHKFKYKLLCCWI